MIAAAAEHLAGEHNAHPGIPHPALIIWDALNWRSPDEPDGKTASEITKELWSYLTTDLDAADSAEWIRLLELWATVAPAAPEPRQALSRGVTRWPAFKSFYARSCSSVVASALFQTFVRQDSALIEECLSQLRTNSDVLRELRAAATTAPANFRQLLGAA